MVQGDFFSKSAVVSGNGDLIVDGSTSSTGAVEIHTVATEGAASVVKEVDTADNGTFDISIPVESADDAIHSQKNKVEISSSENMRLRITDSTGSSQGMHVSGIEVSN